MLPSLVIAKVWFDPALIATTPTALVGIVVCPLLLLPQATTVPLAVKATLCAAPALMATTAVAPAGTVAKPLAALPQLRTVPSLNRASE